MSTLNINQPIRIDSGITLGVARLRLTHADLTDADGSQSFTFNSLALGKGESVVPANARIMSCHLNLLEEFAGGSASAVTLSLGDAGSGTELINALSVFTGAGTGIKAGNGSYTLGTFEAAYAPLVVIASTDDDLDNLTAGIVEISIVYQAIETASLTS